MLLPWILVGLVAVCTIALLRAELAANMQLRAISKLGASTGFVVLGLVQATRNAGVSVVVVVHVAALVLSLIGDACLLGKSERHFLAGLSAFLLAHLGFAASFLYRSSLTSVFLVACLVVGSAAAAAIVWLWKHAQAMRGAIVVYASAIVLMVAAAVNHAATAEKPWIAVGAIAFLISDLAVARDQFVERTLTNRLWGLPLYYAAQVLLALAT